MPPPGAYVQVTPSDSCPSAFALVFLVVCLSICKHLFPFHPPAHLVALFRFVHLIKASPIRLPPLSIAVDAMNPCASFGICVWFYTQYRSTVDLSWPGELGTSDTPVIIYFFLNPLAGVPFSPASVLGSLVIFGKSHLAVFLPRNCGSHLPVFALPFWIGSFALSTLGLVFFGVVGEQRGEARRLNLGYDIQDSRIG